MKKFHEIIYAYFPISEVTSSINILWKILKKKLRIIYPCDLTFGLWPELLEISTLCNYMLPSSYIIFIFKITG